MAGHARENHEGGVVDEPILNANGNMAQKAGHYSRNHGECRTIPGFCGETQNGKDRGNYSE
jgi:hypothetical protein